MTLEPGARVQVNGGLPRNHGHPTGLVWSIGPKAVRLRLFYDGSEHRIAPEHLQVLMPPREGPVVIVPCGATKAAAPVDPITDDLFRAQDLYTGTYHRATMRAARALTVSPPCPPLTNRVFILSARHGFISPWRLLTPYEQQWGQPGEIDHHELRGSAGRQNLLPEYDVVVLAGREYVKRCRDIWPHLVDPLAGTAGIGEQLALLKRIATTGRLPEPTPSRASPARTTDQG